MHVRNWLSRGPCVVLLALACCAPTLLADDDEPKLAGQSSDWDIEQPPGTIIEQVIDASEATWVNVDVSPDGQQLVFDFLGDIYLMSIDGADGTDATKGRRPQKLTSGIAWDMQPRFHPKGGSVSFTSDRSGKSKRSGDNIWVIDRDGNNLRQITNETYRLVNGSAWSPSGEYIVARKHFTSRRSLGAGEIWMYHHAGEAAGAMAGVQLTKRKNDQKDVNEPVFSRDGRFVFYSQDTTRGDTFEYNKDSNKQIYVIKRLDLETGETESYITGPGGACRPVPSPDGKQIAFVRRIGAKTGLHVMDVESGSVRVIYDRLERDMQEAWAIHGVYPTFAWLPDGRSIVAWAKGKIRRIQLADGSATIIPFRIQDTRSVTPSVRFPITVAPDEFDVRMLRWVQTSPRGDQVAYQAIGHIYVRDLPDGEPRRLTSQNQHFEFCPQYSRDGRFITYTTWHDDQLGSVRVASIDPDDAQSWKVTKQPGHYLNPTFSPDGQTIVFEKTGGGHLTSPLWSRDSGIYRVSVHGDDVRRITRRGARPHFANGSDRVLLTRTEGGKDQDNRTLFSVDVATGKESRDHYVSTWATDMRVSPDGRTVAFIERFNVYVTPFVQAGAAIQVGPQAKGIPVKKLSEAAGDWIHFSNDGERLHWALGPTLYTKSLDGLFGKRDNEDGDSNDNTPQASSVTETSIGFRQPYAKPSGTIALVGGKLITMRRTPNDSDSAAKTQVIEHGSIVLRENRIVAIGPSDQVPIPTNATVLDVTGQIVMPGLIDTHAHGSAAANGMQPQRNWVNYARLAFGVTTIHDPSNDTHSIFSASELANAGKIVAPRTFSTGTILYGATGSFKAEVDSLEDARFHLKRMKAVGAFSVKSYNQPRRDQRQQIVAAARELEMMVVPEGGSTFAHNLTMIVDGHTGIEHTLPVQTAYDDVMDLWRGTNVGYTPTLGVAYGGISGEYYWYEVDDLWLHPRLQQFIPPHVLVPRSRRREKAPLEDYNHIRVAEIARQVVDQGGLVQAGGHGQLNGICTHWELWSFVQGGMTPMQAIQCGTLNGARYLGLDADLGSLEVGKLADLIVIEAGYDPTQEIRDTERIQYVIANGRVFDARRMNEWGRSEPRRPFYWEHNRHGGIAGPPPNSEGCGCFRVGGNARWYQDASDQ